MPVGNSDQGVGLSAGDIMVSSDFFYQFIDWRHDQIDDSEPYDHEGTLSTIIISAFLFIPSLYGKFVFQKKKITTYS